MSDPTPDETFAAMTVQVAQQMLADLRWKPDMVVEPPDYPGERWWLRHVDPSPGYPNGSLTACCEQLYPCEHHAAVAQASADTP